MPPVFPHLWQSDLVKWVVLHVCVVHEFLKFDPIRLVSWRWALFFVFYRRKAKNVINHVFQRDSFKSVAVQLPWPVIEISDFPFHLFFTLFDDYLIFGVIVVESTSSKESFIQLLSLAFLPRIFSIFAGLRSLHFRLSLLRRSLLCLLEACS
jgi:hypothetical protein